MNSNFKNPGIFDLLFYPFSLFFCLGYREKEQGTISCLRFPHSRHHIRNLRFDDMGFLLTKMYSSVGEMLRRPEHGEGGFGKTLDE